MDYPMGTPTAQTLEDWKQQCEKLRAELTAAREDRDHYKRALEWADLREPTGMRVALAATEEDGE
jgi:hypothetical protein